MSAQERIVALRAQLLEILRDVEAHVADTAPQRCPYRAMDDRCTLGYGCRNKVGEHCTR